MTLPSKGRRNGFHAPLSNRNCHYCSFAAKRGSKPRPPFSSACYGGVPALVDKRTSQAHILKTARPMFRPYSFI